MSRLRRRRSAAVTAATAPHPLPVAPTTQAEARDLVTRLVAELAGRGALDAGTPYVLDHWVDSLLDGWSTHVRQQAAGRLGDAARRHARLTERLTEASVELTRLRRERDEAAETYRRRRADLDPAPTEPAPDLPPALAEPHRPAEMPAVVVPPRPALAAVLERTGADIDLRAPAPTHEEPA